MLTRFYKCSTPENGAAFVEECINVSKLMSAVSETLPSILH